MNDTNNGVTERHLWNIFIKLKQMKSANTVHTVDKSARNLQSIWCDYFR